MGSKINLEDIELVHIASKKRKCTCKYYRNPGKTYTFEDLGPKGLCLDLYATAYPYCLALLYGAKFSWEQDKEKVNAQCPSPVGTVYFEVERKKFKKEKKIVHPQDPTYIIKKNSKILIKIKNIEIEQRDYENICSCNHKIGQEFEFNQGDYFGQMCPAAFNSIYPTLKIIASGGDPLWKKNSLPCVLCPDNFPRIEFEIKEKNGKN